MYYRKKPIVVKAEQFWPVPRERTVDHDGNHVTLPEKIMHGVIKIPAMTVDARQRRGITYDTPARYVVNTLEGQMEIQPGDWLITGVKGEMYPCKPDIFEMCYEPSHLPKFKRSMHLGSGLLAAVLLAAVLCGMSYCSVHPW